MLVRLATSRDEEAIQGVHFSAFAEDEREVVAKLAIDLLAEETRPPTVSLVAELEGVVAGHATFSPVSIDGEERLQGYILAPLGVAADVQKRGVGSELVASGKRQLLEMGADVLFVYGDPKYYGRFGFSVDAAQCFVPPYELRHPGGWQCVGLREMRPPKSQVKTTCVASLSDPTLW